MNKTPKRSGMTLIDVLFYTFMFGFLLLALVRISLFLSTSSQQTSMRSLLVTESSVVMNRVAKGLADGATFNSGGSTLGSDSSVLAFTNKDSDNIVYRVNAQSILEQGVNGSYADLHSEDIIIDTFRVDRLNPANSGFLFRVTIDFSNIYGDQFTLTRSVNFLYE